MVQDTEIYSDTAHNNQCLPFFFTKKNLRINGPFVITCSVVCQLTFIESDFHSSGKMCMMSILGCEMGSYSSIPVVI